MRLRGKRWLLGCCAVALVANHAMAAMRACTSDLLGGEHGAIQRLEAQGSTHVCTETTDATQCLPHCAQSAKSTEPNIPTDVPTLVIGTSDIVVLVSQGFSTPAPAAVSTPPAVGPPLTILFRNLRN
jgi:hypothetical protein